MAAYTRTESTMFSKETLQLGDLIRLATGDAGVPRELRGQLAVVTELHDAHLSVFALDSKLYYLSECWPNYSSIESLVSTVGRLGQEVAITQGPRCVGRRGVVVVDVSRNHPPMFEDPRQARPPRLFFAVRLAGRKQQVVQMDPRCLEVRAQEKKKRQNLEQKSVPGEVKQTEEKNAEEKMAEDRPEERVCTEEKQQDVKEQGSDHTDDRSEIFKQEESAALAALKRVLDPEAEFAAGNTEKLPDGMFESVTTEAGSFTAQGSSSSDVLCDTATEATNSNTTAPETEAATPPQEMLAVDADKKGTGFGTAPEAKKNKAPFSANGCCLAGLRKLWRF